MANAKQYSELDAATSVSSEDLFAVSQAGAPELKKATVAQVAEPIADVLSTGALAELEYATSQGKNAVAQALTNKGVATTASETLIQMADKVNGLNIAGDVEDIYGWWVDGSTSGTACTRMYKYTIPGSLDMVIFLPNAKQILYVPYGEYESVAQILSSYSVMLQLETYTTQNADPAFSHDGSKLLLIHDDLHEIYDISSSAITLNKTVSITHENSSYKNSQYCITDDAKYITYVWREGTNVSGTVHLVLVNTISGLSATYTPGWGSYYSTIYCSPRLIWDGNIYGGKTDGSSSFYPFYIPFEDTENEITFGNLVLAEKDLGHSLYSTNPNDLKVDIIAENGKPPIFIRVGGISTIESFSSITQSSMYYYTTADILSGADYKSITLYYFRPANSTSNAGMPYSSASSYEYELAGDEYKISFFFNPADTYYINPITGAARRNSTSDTPNLGISVGGYLTNAPGYQRYGHFYFNKTKNIVLVSNSLSSNGTYFGSGTSNWTSYTYTINNTKQLFGKLRKNGELSSYKLIVGTVTKTDLQAGRYAVSTVITPAVPDTDASQN